MKDEASNPVPLILAPGGARRSFLAAIAAGADAVYCGLKSFSARMEAKNFSIENLVPLAELAREKGVALYIALNSLIRPEELSRAEASMEALNARIQPDALIIQDLSIISLARKTGFKGELHLSTLSNFCFPLGFRSLKNEFAVSRAVLPRELTIDEIKTMAAACPVHMDLEVFVHGALCFGVSGRCYWSSYLGGKSGLRGRCVQPCRRVYDSEGRRERFFSCKDLSLDVLVKVLKSIPKIRAWKIEGRKKGPHYVFYTVKAYRMLRDYGHDPAAKREALGLLERSLGRPGTHYYFLPQRPQQPVDIDQHACSGLFIGRIKGKGSNTSLQPRDALISGDVLRVGDEDASFHATVRVNRSVPKQGRLNVKLRPGMGSPKGTPVFLTDRCEPELERLISNLAERLPPDPAPAPAPVPVSAAPEQHPEPKTRKPTKSISMSVGRTVKDTASGMETALWVSESNIEAFGAGRKKNQVWWWLPPVLWPHDEDRISGLIQKLSQSGNRRFVINIPWQTAFFPEPDRYRLWAGPFCNISNPEAAETLKEMGASGVIAGPELCRADLTALARASTISLGIVVHGWWPLSISRRIQENNETTNIYESPKKEIAWGVRHENDLWLYPNWKIDIQDKISELNQMGFEMMVYLNEPLPENVIPKNRPGRWNWDLNLV